MNSRQMILHRSRFLRCLASPGLAILCLTMLCLAITCLFVVHSNVQPARAAEKSAQQIFPQAGRRFRSKAIARLEHSQRVGHALQMGRRSRNELVPRALLAIAWNENPIPGTFQE